MTEIRKKRPKKRAKPKGWRKEPARHGLAAKGVKTKRLAHNQPLDKTVQRLNLKPGMMLKLRNPATFWSKNYMVTMNPGEKVKYIGLRHMDMAFRIKGMSEDMFLTSATKGEIWKHGDLDFHVLFEEG